MIQNIAIVIIFSFLFVSCQQQSINSPRDTIIDIRTAWWVHVWYGVAVGAQRVFTARHVIDDCGSACRYYLDDQEIQILGVIDVLWGDRAGISTSTTMPYIRAVSYESLGIDTPAYTLVSRSGSWQRIEGRITALDASYIWYDSSLSGGVFTGAIETDIVLEVGESGTPIWILSWELVGVMSAVDRERGRGYIARP
jgi:S1-C subfamily serine protease